MTKFDNKLFNTLKDEQHRAAFIKKQTRLFWFWVVCLVVWGGLVVADIFFSKGRYEWSQLTAVLWLATCVAFIERARWSLRIARFIETMSSDGKIT